MNKLIRGLLLPFLFIPTMVTAEKAVVVEENDLKAAFSIKFLKYVDIQNLSDVINVCVHGESGIFNSFNKFDGYVQNGYTIRIKPILINEVGNCNLLYISKAINESDDTLKELRSLQNVLTVSDITGFVQSYGVVELKRRERSLAFGINLKQAKESNIFIKSELLKLADEIVE